MSGRRTLNRWQSWYGLWAWVLIAATIALVTLSAFFPTALVVLFGLFCGVAIFGGIVEVLWPHAFLWWRAADAEQWGGYLAPLLKIEKGGRDSIDYASYADDRRRPWVRIAGVLMLALGVGGLIAIVVLRSRGVLA